MQLDFDLHVTQILVLFVVLGSIVGYQAPAEYKHLPVLLGLVIPQGRILVRAFWDYPSLNKPKAPYLLANELQAVLAALACAAISYLG